MKPVKRACTGVYPYAHELTPEPLQLGYGKRETEGQKPVYFSQKISGATEKLEIEYTGLKICSGLFSQHVSSPEIQDYARTRTGVK